MKKEPRFFSKWMYWFTLVVALIIVYKVLDSFAALGDWFSNFMSVVNPFIIGIILAYVLYIPSRKLESIYKKIKFINNKARLLSVLTTYLILILTIIIAFRFLIPVVISSLQDLIENLQSYYLKICEMIMQLPEDSILKSEGVMKAVSELGNFKVEDYLNVDMIFQYAQGLMSFASGIFSVFVSLVVSVYLLLERHEIVNFCGRFSKAIFKSRTYRNIKKYFRDSNEIFCKFLAGQFIDAIVVGILTTVAMSIMKIKYAPLLGVFIGLFNMIPYFGAIIAVVISGVLTILTGGLSKAIEMVVVVVILQQIDANIINPKIIGDSLKISPLLIVFSVTVAGAYFGVLGMFLAVPVTAVIKIIICDYIEYKNKERIRSTKLTNSDE